MKVFTTKTVTCPDQGQEVAIIGYGSQGHAHAQNLNDSGVKVVVGLRKGGASWDKVRQGRPGDESTTPSRPPTWSAILLPDEFHPRGLQANVAPTSKGATLAFAHGFNVHCQPGRARAPTLDVIMVARKARPHRARSTSRAAACPCLIAVYQDKSGKARDLALSYAMANGGGKGGIIETNFKEETETDLFGEQAGCCAAARSSWSRWASRPGPKPVTRRKWPISSACTSSS